VRDGRLAFWVDGQLAGDFPGIQLRSTDSLQPNHVAISTYSSEVHENKTLWYDDVVAATSYIGPMYPPGGTGGSPGTGGSGAAPAGGGTATGGAGTGGSGTGGAATGGAAQAGEDLEEGGCGCRVDRGTSTTTSPIRPYAFLGLLLLACKTRRSRRRLPAGIATATPAQPGNAGALQARCSR
jgi:hypothetical protein